MTLRATFLIALLFLCPASSFAAETATPAFEVDGIVLGEMPCEQAVKKVFSRSSDDCSQYKSDDEKDPLVQSGERKRSTKELCEDVVRMQEEVALESFKQFKPSTPLGAVCARPSSQVDDRFLDAFGLTISGSVDFSEFRYKGCPFTKFFVTADKRPTDASPNKMACDSKKVIFYSKQVVAPFEKIKKALLKKYGRPVRHWGHWKIGNGAADANEVYQVNVEHVFKGIHILAVNLATVENSGDIDLLGVNKNGPKKSPTEDRLDFRSESVVFYFSESYLQTNRNKFKLLDDQRAQEEERTKQDSEQKEKRLLDEL